MLKKSGRARPERGRAACIRTAGHLQPARGSTSSWITGREAPFCSRGAIVERDDKTISEDPRRQGCTRCARALRIASAARDLAAHRCHRACSHILPTDGSRAIFARMARKGSRHSATIRRVQRSRRVLSHQSGVLLRIFAILGFVWDPGRAEKRDRPSSVHCGPVREVVSTHKTHTSRCTVKRGSRHERCLARSCHHSLERENLALHRVPPGCHDGARTDADAHRSSRTNSTR